MKKVFLILAFLTAFSCSNKFLGGKGGDGGKSVNGQNGENGKNGKSGVLIKTAKKNR
jgi:hypothetical protein